MLLKVNHEIDRCKRVMRERVWPHIHQVLAQCTVGAVKTRENRRCPLRSSRAQCPGRSFFSRSL